MVQDLTPRLCRAPPVTQPAQGDLARDRRPFKIHDLTPGRLDGLAHFVLRPCWRREMAAILERLMSSEQLDHEGSPQPDEASPAAPSAVSVTAPSHPGTQDFHIVGIGASAGGLDSLERLFTHLPTDTGMAFVVLQHLSPDFKSLMDELLSRRTQMPIRQADHDMALEPNTVYLLPPMKEMIIRHRRLLLNDRDPRHGLTLPIDLFFRSLAQDVGRARRRGHPVRQRQRRLARCAGDQQGRRRGALRKPRYRAVQRHAAQRDAHRHGRPGAAARGDRRWLSPPSAGRPRDAPPGRASDEERGVDAILRLLRDEYAIDFSHYKAGTVTRRIERRLALNRSLDIDMYVEQLRSDPRELSSLYEDLLIGVTRFFRDDAAFDTLEHRIIPELVERTDADEQIRVWVPGLRDRAGSVFDRDAAPRAARARAGARSTSRSSRPTCTRRRSRSRAPASTARNRWPGIGQERLQQFFTLKPNGYQISQTLRESIVFAPHNLIRDAPFTKMDLITCRNLLIYFQPHAQKTVLTLFHFALKPGGFLFLGSSESPGGLIDEFDTIDEHAKIYRKRRDIGLPRDLKLPLPRSGAVPRTLAATGAAQRRRQPAAPGASTTGCSIGSCRRVSWSTSTGSWSTPSAASSRC